MRAEQDTAGDAGGLRQFTVRKRRVARAAPFGRSIT